jgi:hypothetical protein
VAVTLRKKRNPEWGNLTNVQCKAIQNCHNESSLYNEYILKKKRRKKEEEGREKEKKEEE